MAASQPIIFSKPKEGIAVRLLNLALALCVIYGPYLSLKPYWPTLVWLMPSESIFKTVITTAFQVASLVISNSLFTLLYTSEHKYFEQFKANNVCLPDSLALEDRPGRLARSAKAHFKGDRLQCDCHRNHRHDHHIRDQQYRHRHRIVPLDVF